MIRASYEIIHAFERKAYGCRMIAMGKPISGEKSLLTSKMLCHIILKELCLLYCNLFIS